jgi:hypothetical protein
MLFRFFVGLSLFASAPALANGPMSLHGSDIQVGVPFELTVTGAQPGESVTFLRSSRVHTMFCAPPAQGACRDLAAPAAVFATATADEHGLAVVQGELADNADVSSVAFQAVILSDNSRATEPVAFSVREASTETAEIEVDVETHDMVVAAL